MSYSLQASARMDLGENNRNTDSSHDHLEGSQARGRLPGANNNLDPLPSAEGPFCSGEATGHRSGKETQRSCGQRICLEQSRGYA